MAEAGLIVASVLLGFWIEAWWSGRQELRLEFELVSAAAEEASANRRQLLSVIQESHERLELIDAFLARSPSELANVDSSQVRDWVVALPNAPEFFAEEAGASMLVQTPILDASGVSVRQTASMLIREIQGLERNRLDLQQNRLEIQRHLTGYQARGDLRLRRVPWGVAELSPDILSDLRSDPDLIRMLLHKRHIQDVYVVELEENVIPLLEELEQTARDALGGAL